MIKANELRIGNYVHPCTHADPVIIPMNNIFARIFTIEFDGCRLALDHKKPFAQQECGLWEYKRIKPIPLTEEWLVRFGFEVKKHKWIVATHKLNTDFVINNAIDGSMRFTPVWCKDYKPIIFVHQLQNLYFALTGEELTIKE